VVVFLTGTQPFPEGTGGSVYIRLPFSSDSNDFGNWLYLGFICNAKPSAIFKVAQLNKSSMRSEALFTNTVFSQSGGDAGTAQIGIMVEPLSAIEAKVPPEGSTPSYRTTIEEFPRKMLQSFLNHVQSFAVRMPRPDNAFSTADYVPITAVQEWYNTFQRRLSMNSNFWKSLP